MYPSDAELIFREVVNSKKTYRVYARPFEYAKNPERGVTYWDWTLAPIMDAGGEVELLLFSLYDVTESVKVAQELERFFTLSIDMLCIIDFAGNFIKANPTFEKTLGYSREELLSKQLWDLTHPEDQKGARNSLKKAISSTEPMVHLESRHCCKDNTYKWLEWVGYIEHSKGLIYTIARDITERKKLEEEIRRLESLSLLGKLTAEINHEIRNPMASVRGLLQLLYEKEECLKYREYFELMIGELDRANAVNLGNTLVIELAAIPDLWLDEKSIRQLILNLVRNGLEAMANNGVLAISTFYEQGDVVLAVQDRGTGIGQDVIAKLGTPFVTTKENGMGLGLSICYNIARKHNAAIELKTGADGTTFYVRLQTEQKCV